MYETKEERELFVVKTKNGFVDYCKYWREDDLTEYAMADSMQQAKKYSRCQANRVLLELGKENAIKIQVYFDDNVNQWKEIKIKLFETEEPIVEKVVKKIEKKLKDLDIEEKKEICLSQQNCDNCPLKYEKKFAFSSYCILRNSMAQLERLFKNQDNELNNFLEREINYEITRYKTI